MYRRFQQIWWIRCHATARWLAVSALLAVVLIAAVLSSRAVRFANTRRHLEMNGWEVQVSTRIPAGSFGPLEYSLPLSWSTGFERNSWQ